MKTWKTAGCLSLLVVIVAVCIVLAQNTTVSAQAPTQEQEQATPEVPEGDTGGEEAPAPSESLQGSAAVDKTYSKGLYFRSNGDGTCALSGMGSCTDVCVLIPPQSPAGDTVTEILPYAFAGSTVGAIEIPTTVREASAASFADCKGLGYVRVAAGNTALAECDGALYTADGSTLLYCPAGRTAKSLTLPTALKRIAAGAMADCAALETVCFSGNTAEWHAVIVGDENDALYGARIVFAKQ